MESLENVIRYPTERENWVQTVLIGGVLMFLGVFLVPLIAVYGYLMETIRGSLDGEAGPPAFDDWGALLTDGVQAAVILFVFMLIPIIVAAITIGGVLLSMVVALATGGSPEIAAAGAVAFGFVVSGLLALAFGYVAVAAIVNFARAEEFGAAFDVTTLRRVLVHRDYAVAWLVSAVLLIAVGLVSSIPAIGWLLAPFASFYALVVAANLWADGFSAALGLEERPGDVSDREPAI